MGKSTGKSTEKRDSTGKKYGGKSRDFR
jgi:hypothetical protein